MSTVAVHKPSPPGTNTSASLCWPMHHAPKLSYLQPSDLPVRKPQRKVRIPRRDSKANFTYLEQVLEEDEDEKPIEPLPPLESMRGAIGRARISRGISYLLPNNEGKVSIQNTYDPDLSALFKRPHRNKTNGTSRGLRSDSKYVSTSNSSLPLLSSNYSPSTLFAGTGHGDNKTPPKTPKSDKEKTRLRRSSLQIEPQVKELLDSFVRCDPYTEPVKPTELPLIVQSTKKDRDINSGSSVVGEDSVYLSGDKLDMVWTWLNTEDEEKKKQREEADESWMYE